MKGGLWAAAPGESNIEGDRVRERFEALYKKYGPIVYARCRRILRDSAAAEDATQEVFLKVARHLDAAPTTSEALLWIHRIATNHCLNELRNDSRRPRFVEEVEPARNPRSDEMDLVDRDLVQRVIAHVPDPVGASAWLHHVDGMNHDEVGRALGLSRRTIFNYLADFHRRARRFLERNP